MNNIYKHLAKGSLLLLLIGIFLGCDKTSDDEQCVRVRYSTEYCAEAKPLHLVEFLNPNSDATPLADANPTRYFAAISDLPANVQKTDSIFYLYYHYDKKLAKKLEPERCQAMFSSVNILICDRVSSDPCETQIDK